MSNTESHNISGTLFLSYSSYYLVNSFPMLSIETVWRFIFWRCSLPSGVHQLWLTDTSLLTSIKSTAWDQLWAPTISHIMPFPHVPDLWTSRRCSSSWSGRLVSGVVAGTSTERSVTSWRKCRLTSTRSLQPVRRGPSQHTLWDRP